MTDTNAAPLEGPDRPGTLTRAQRDVTRSTRETIARVLRDGCHHDPGGWYTAPDTAGRPLTTCYACGVSWYAAPA